MVTLITSFLLWAQPAGQPKQTEKAKVEEPAEVKVITLKNLDAAEITSMLQQLFQDRTLRIAHHAKSNTLLAVGSAEKLRLVEEIIGSLQKAPDPKNDKPERKVVPVKNHNAGDLVGILQQLFQERPVRFVADARVNAVLLSGPAEEVQAVMAIIKQLEELPPVSPIGNAP